MFKKLDIGTIEDNKVCGKCGSTNLNNLGRDLHEATVICLNRECQAKWWKKWYTKEEWFNWINDIKIVETTLVGHGENRGGDIFDSFTNKKD